MRLNGFCCIKSPCWVSLRIYGGASTECPALKWDENRYICELMVKGPRKDEYKDELYAGKGCCCGLNDWRKDVKPRREKDIPKPTVVKYNMDKAFQAFVLAMSREFISGDMMFLTCMGMAKILKKSGTPPEEIEAILREIDHIRKQNRSRFMDEFMG